MLSKFFRSFSTANSTSIINSVATYCNLKSTSMVFGLCILCLSFLITSQIQAQHQEINKSLHQNFVTFDHPDGVYSNSLLSGDFGNGSFFQNRNFACITDSVYRVTFKKGEKVKNTGASTKIDIPSARQYTLEYKIKYPLNFESGLHGKQFGFRLGVGYDGGRAEEARTKGDGGSVRIQFDALDDSISNQLYVYYSGMSGKYGNNPGDYSYKMARKEWNTIRLTVTMESTFENSDGRIEVWCNNIKTIDVKGMAFVREDSQRFITGVSFESFPGGGGIFPTYDNHLYVDNFHWRPGY